MRQFSRTFGRYVVTVYGGGVALAIQAESLTGSRRDVAFLQGDEAGELYDMLDGADDSNGMVEALLTEYDA